MAKVEDVATYIINSLEVDNLKLQKLLYYCQGIHLVQYDKVLFEDKIEAWQFGPVVPLVYHKYKEFGHKLLEPNYEEVDFTNEEQETVDMVLDCYGGFSGVQLINKTHQESPWRDAYKPGKQHCEITIDSMKKYFKANVNIKEA